MDYEFIRNINGQVTALFSMDYEAMGYWLNEEIKADLAKIDLVKRAAESLRNNQSWQLEGHEFSLFMNVDEITVQANQLNFEQEEVDPDELEREGLEDGMSYYNDESASCCGLTDFLQMLDCYQQFIKEYA